MRYIRYIFVAYIVFFTGALFSQNTNIEPYLLWIAANTEYTDAATLPRDQFPVFVYLSDAEFNKQFGEETKAATSLNPPNNIYLRRSTEHNTRFDALIIHELVHYFQIMHGKKYPCTAAMEEPAYAAQIKYLSEHNEEIGMSLVNIAFLTKCLTPNFYELNNQ